MSTRFDYVKYDETAIALQAEFKEKFISLEETAEQLSGSRWRSELLTQLEYAYMCAGKAIRDDQIKWRESDLQEQRTNI